MRTSRLLLLLLIAAASCTHSDVPVPVLPPAVAAEDPDWIRLEIPTGREAYAIAGDIDKTLLVTTWSKAYYSTDRGKTWTLSRDFQGPVPGLLVRNDTTFSMQSYASDWQGNLLGSSMVQYFTPDYGRTWLHYFQYYKGYLDYIKPIGRVESTTGIVYSIQENTTPRSANSFYVNPSALTRADKFGRQTLRFPFKHKLTNLSLDAQNRLYVAASGGTYQPDNNTFLCCTDAMPAVVYVSRKPLP